MSLLRVQKLQMQEDMSYVSGCTVTLLFSKRCVLAVYTTTCAKHVTINVVTHPLFAKLVQYVMTTALSMMSFLEKLQGNRSVGPTMGMPNT